MAIELVKKVDGNFFFCYAYSEVGCNQFHLFSVVFSRDTMGVCSRLRFMGP